MSRARRINAGLVVLSLPLLLAACSGSEVSSPASPQASSVSRQAQGATGDWKRELTMADYSTVVEKSSGLYVVLVKSDSCGWPCSEMSRTVANVLDSRNRPANYGTVNPDNEFELTNYLRIRSLPTTLLYRDGVLVAQTSGAMPEYKFTEWMSEHAQ